MEISTLLLYILLSILLGVGIYHGYKFTKAAAKVLSELFVMYRIFTGEGSHRGTTRPLRLYSYIFESQYMDEVTVNELYYFLTGSGMADFQVGDKDQTISFLHKGFLNYSHMVLFRDKIDGSLRGISMIGINRFKEYTTLKMGPTYFKNYYKGGPLGYLILGYLVLKELIFHPFTPLYLVGKAISYHSYLVAMKFKESYPRYDRETPEHFKKILNEFAQSELHGGDSYDEETNVIKQRQAKLQENLSAISERDLKNPHIKFFAERNPGHKEGDLLIAGWRMGWYDVTTFSVESFKKSFQRSKLKESGPGRTQGKKPKPLLRRYTFQEASANAYAVDMYQVDMGGEAILSPSNQNFTFSLPLPKKSPKSPTSAVPDFTIN